MRSLAKEIERRRGIAASCFDKQAEAIADKSRQKAILTSRRAGKTNTVLIDMVLDALDNPNVKYAYIGLSRITAENIVWKELERIDQDHSLRLDLQGYRLRAIFPNGSSITLYGADQPGWIKKFKGAKYRKVVIDEAGEFDIDLQDFIYRVIRPTLTDYLGTLWLIGTPGVVPSGYWWKVTNPEESERARGWKLFQWHSLDNPFITDNFQQDLDALRDEYGDDLEQLPWYRREWLGEWCFDDSGNVYKYRPEKNDIESYDPEHGVRYILAVDPGFKDSTSFIVGAYNPEQLKDITYIDCYKRPGMLFNEIIEKTREYQAIYPGLRIIGDPDAAHILAEMRKHGIPVENAIKTKKQDAISIMNNGFVSGRIKLLMPNCKSYANELYELKRYYKASDEIIIGDQRVGTWKEHPKQPNDLCDGGLYIYRHIGNRPCEETPTRPEYGTEEYYSEVESRLKEQARNKMNKDQRWWRNM